MALSICDVHTNTNNMEITPHGSVFFPVACYEDDMQRITVPMHWHDEFEYIAAIKGKVIVYVNGEEIILDNEDAIFINGGCLHGVKTVTEESLLHSLVIKPKFIGGSFDGIIFKELITPFLSKNALAYVLLNDGSKWQTLVRKNMLKAWKVVIEESYDFENESRYYISRAMRILLDNTEQRGNISVVDAAKIERIKEALVFIENNYKNEIGNQDLAKWIKCSESALLRCFNEMVGKSPMQYLMNYRLQKAVELLATTGMQSNEIAIVCGFKDASYFTKLFKREVGVTPIEYRKSLKK